MKLIPTKHFDRSYKKFVKQYPYLESKIKNTLQLMEEDIFNPILNTHKLEGKLYHLNSCSCRYDCRIIFEIDLNKTTNEEEIILLDIGTHDEVY